MILELVVGVGLVMTIVAWCCQHRALSERPLPPPDPAPPVTILKPLKGLDPGLEANLESIFSLDYPAFEVILGSPDEGDPALDIARSVAAAHPNIPSRVLVVKARTSSNPKVNLLAGLAREAHHDVWLISDSNIRVAPGYLGDLAARLGRDGVGLVSSFFRGTEGGGLGGAIESLQLNTYVMGGVATLQRLVGMPAVVGKSMLFRKTDLAAIGGFDFLGTHLAEDQICGESIWRLGRKVDVSSNVIDNVLGRRTLRQFLDRHLRWCRMRYRITLAGYCGEFLLNPTFFAVVGAIAFRSFAVAGISLAIMSLLAAITERRLGIRRFLPLYPLLELMRSLIVAGVWFVPFVSSTVTWRGDRLRIGARTHIAIDISHGDP